MTKIRITIAIEQANAILSRYDANPDSYINGMPDEDKDCLTKEVEVIHSDGTSTFSFTAYLLFYCVSSHAATHNKSIHDYDQLVKFLFTKLDKNKLTSSLISISREHIDFFKHAIPLLDKLSVPDLTEILKNVNLNATATTGPYAGTTPLDWLTGKLDGRALLNKLSAADLAEILKKGNLNTTATTGPNAGITPLYWLTSKLDGRALLNKLSAADLAEILKKGNLNTTATTGPNAGITPLDWLTSKSDGRALLNKLSAADLAEILKKGNLDATATAGPYAGFTPLYWLTANQDGLALLNKLSAADLAEILKKGNLDATATAGPHAGITPLCWLTANQDGRALLNKLSAADLAEILKNGNPDATEIEGPDAGITPLHWLTCNSEALALLDKLSVADLTEILKKGNLDAAATTGPNAGITPLCGLTDSSEGLALLDKLSVADLTEILKKGNLDAAATTGPYAGSTPLCGLTDSSEGLALLDKLSVADLTEILKKGNLDAAATAGPHAGITPLCWLTGSPNGRALLNKLSATDLAEILKKGNLDATDTTGPNAGLTPLCWLTDSRDGRTLLNKLSAADLTEILKKSNLDAGRGEKTVLSSFINNEEGVALLRKCPRSLINPKRHLKCKLSDCIDEGLQKFLVLMGADLTPSQSGIGDENKLNQFKKFKHAFWSDVQEKAALLFDANGISTLPTDAYTTLELVGFSVFDQQYPELGFLKPALQDFLDLAYFSNFGLRHDNPVYKLAVLIICEYKKEVAGYLEKEATVYYQQMVIECLQQNIPPNDSNIIMNMTFRKKLIANIIEGLKLKNNKLLVAGDIRAALSTVLQEMQPSSNDVLSSAAASTMFGTTDATNRPVSNELLYREKHDQN